MFFMGSHVREKDFSDNQMFVSRFVVSNTRIIHVPIPLFILCQGLEFLECQTIIFDYIHLLSLFRTFTVLFLIESHSTPEIRSQCSVKGTFRRTIYLETHVLRMTYS